MHRRLSECVAPLARWILGAGLLCACGVAPAEQAWIEIPSRTVTPHLRAYAQVAPVASVEVRALQAGVATGLDVLPGATVKAGQLLARLGGPDVDALATQRTMALASARSVLSTAQRTLAIEREKQASHLSTKEALDEAEAAEARARADFETAQAQLKALHQTEIVRAPADGVVRAVSAANGERLAQGERILTLVPSGGLWLQAQYYGADVSAIHSGMTGKFSPASGTAPISVEVRTLIGPVQPDGGQAVGLVASGPSPQWFDGEAGTLTLKGAERSLAAVPTRALVLDRGQWWVLVHTPQGPHRQAVTPGPSRGEWTLIEQGLAPGAKVVVENVYLEFHRAFSQHYQAPD